MRNTTYTKIRERLVQKAKTIKQPILGHFELTARCNLDCKMCYVHTLDNALALKKELSTEQWIRIFDEAIESGMIYASLSGGECLMRKDFKDLYLHLWNKNIYITVMSNGVLLNDDYVEFFKTYQPDMIQISLYGSDENGYLNVTGHRGFEKAFHAITALNSANIDVRVAVTPSKYMGDDYLEIYRLCKQNRFAAVLGDIILLPNRDNPNKDDYYLNIEETVDLSIRRAELYRKLLPLDSTPEYCGPMSSEPSIGLTCNAGNCLATVTYDGTMYPCVNAMIGGASLLEMNYSDAWNATVEAASKVVLGRECIGCAYNETCPKCPSMRLTDLYSGHCNPSMCELTRKLVAVGVKKIELEEKNCD